MPEVHVKDEEGRPLPALLHVRLRGSLERGRHDPTDGRGQGIIAAPNGEAYTVQISARGFVSARFTMRPETRKWRRPVEIRLRRGREVQGIVLDPGGNPVENCHVQASNLGCWVTPEQRALTDAKGRFRLGGLAGLCALSWQYGEFSPVTRIRWIAGWLPWRYSFRITLRRPLQRSS